MTLTLIAILLSLILLTLILTYIEISEIVDYYRKRDRKHQP